MRPIRCLVVLALLVFPAVAGAQAWTRLSTNGVPSEPRHFGFTSDPNFDFYLLYGGFTSCVSSTAVPVHLDETWVFDGIQQSWTQITPATNPGPRTAELAFDSGRSRFVLYGGANTQNAIYDDTWEFDGADWAQIPIAANATPGGRNFHTLSHDQGTGETILFGGLNASFSNSDATWVYDGMAWTDVTSTQRPPRRSRHQMVYDAGRGVHVMFGGRGNLTSEVYDDTWEFDATTSIWTQVATPVRPPARMDHAMGYDPVRGVVVLYGGWNFNGSAPPHLYGDVWEYDGTSWTQVAVGALSSPGGQFEPQFASSPNGLVLYGGSYICEEVWHWGGGPGVGIELEGSGGDCRIDVGLNAPPSLPAVNVIPVAAGDALTLGCVSPLGGLDFARFALIGSGYPQGSPPSGLTLFGSGPSDVWVDPSNAVVIIDSLGASGSVLVPTLVPGGFVLGPYNIPAGLAGQALNLQIFAQDPMANPVGISTSNAVALEFQ